MSVNGGNKLTRHMKRAELIVFITTRRTKTAFATKRNEFNIFDDGIPGMEFINHLFIIISKNGL